MIRFDTARRLFAFAVVGGLSAGLDAGVFLALVWFGLTPWLASALSFLSAFVINYFGNRNLVFQHKGDQKGALRRYVILVAFNFGVSAGGVAWLTSLALEPWLAKGISMAVIAVFNYILMKRWVFGASSRFPEESGLIQTSQKHSEY